MQEHIETERIMVYALDVESLWTGTVITVQNAWKRLGNTTDKTKNFIGKITSVQSVGKIKCQTESGHARNAGPKRMKAEKL